MTDARPAPASIDPNDLTAVNVNALKVAAEIVDVAGFLTETDNAARAELGSIAAFADGAHAVLEGSASVEEGVRRIARVIEDSRQSTEESLIEIRTVTQQAREVASWVEAANVALTEVERVLRSVLDANRNVSAISRQINILAINAKVESARAGEAGRGFSVVADEINHLASETSQAAKGISANIDDLAARMTILREEATIVAGDALSVRTAAEESDAKLDAIGGALGRASSETTMVVDDAHRVKVTGDSFAPRIGSLKDTFQVLAAGTKAGLVELPVFWK